MYNRLLSVLKRHNVLTSDQHGFMKSKSRETASHSSIQSVQEALDGHLRVVDIFLDLSKAYDVINHNRLLDKLTLGLLMSYIYIYIYIYIWSTHS